MEVKEGGRDINESEHKAEPYGKKGWKDNPTRERVLITRSQQTNDTNKRDVDYENNKKKTLHGEGKSERTTQPWGDNKQNE